MHCECVLNTDSCCLDCGSPRLMHLLDQQNSANFTNDCVLSRITTENFPTSLQNPQNLSSQSTEAKTETKTKKKKMVSGAKADHMELRLTNGIDRFAELEKLFTGEESYGRYLDLNALHTEYINLKGVKKLDYLQYLNAFDNFESTYPKTIKNSPEYRQYVWSQTRISWSLTNWIYLGI